MRVKLPERKIRSQLHDAYYKQLLFRGRHLWKFSSNADAPPVCGALENFANKIDSNGFLDCYYEKTDTYDSFREKTSFE